MAFLQSIKLSGFLSFPPDSPAFDLTPLNVLIGPNGSGKSNLLEAFELLHATPTALAALVREGGTAQEWLWKGDPPAEEATVEVVVARRKPPPDLRYYLSLAPSGLRTEVVDEAIEETEKRSPSDKDVFFYYRFQRGRPVLYQRDTREPGLFTKKPAGNSGLGRLMLKPRRLQRQTLLPDESVLSQRKDPDLYPELTWLGQQFGRIQTFRDWTFGRSAPLRRPQRGDLPFDELLPNAENLGLLLNELQHTRASEDFNHLLTRFLPRYQRFSTRIQGTPSSFIFMKMVCVPQCRPRGFPTAPSGSWPCLRFSCRRRRRHFCALRSRSLACTRMPFPCLRICWLTLHRAHSLLSPLTPTPWSQL